jgi:hypothetical protein
MSAARAASVPAACATIRHSGGTGGDSSADYSHVTVTFPEHGGSLTAERLTLSGAKVDVGEDTAGDLADASSVLLLAALTGHHNAACSQWLETEGRAAEAGLRAGQKLSVAWNGGAASRGALRISFGSATLAIGPEGGNAAARLSFSGVSTSGTQITALLPSSAQASFSLPTSELAALMASTAGKATRLPAVHVTINSLSARRDTVELSGSGHAVLTGENANASAGGHLEIRDIEGLIDRARQDGQNKVAAALVIARLVSHKRTDSNTWDTTWEGGVLTVNGVPLPLR